MAKNKKNKQEDIITQNEEVVIASSSDLLEETEVENNIVEEQKETVVEENPTISVVVKEEVKPEVKQVKTEPKKNTTGKPLVCESRHTRMHYAFTQPGLARHLRINNNF